MAVLDPDAVGAGGGATSPARKSSTPTYLHATRSTGRSVPSPRFSDARHTSSTRICPKCGEHFEIGEVEADHATPWSKGGKTPGQISGPAWRFNARSCWCSA